MLASLSSFLLEALRLLYWIYFKPLTLRQYVHSLEPDLPEGYSLWQARGRLRHNPRLRRLLLHALFLVVILPWPAAALAGRLTGDEVNWFAVAFIVAVGVAVGVAFGVAYGVAVGVAFGITGGVAFGVVVVVAPSVAVSVAVGVAPGVAGGVAVGVAVGVAYVITVGVAFGVAVGVVGVVVLGVVVGVVVGVVAGVAYGGAFGVGGGVALVVGYLRLYLYPLELLWLWGVWGVARLQPQWAPALLRSAPHQWDEVIWFPLWGVNEIARQVARADLPLGLAEIQKLFDTIGQKPLARRALADVTSDVLCGYTRLEQVAGAAAQVTWLPQDLRALRPDVAEVVPGLLSLAADLAQNWPAANPLGRKALLREGVERLGVSRQRLLSLGREGNERWRPVIDQWHTLLLNELESLATVSATAGGVENPYEVGNPVPLTRKNLFKGRGALRDAVSEAMRQRGRVTLVLSGPRRMGKTTFLQQLPALLPGRAVPVYLDLQDPAVTANDGAFLYRLARALVLDAQTMRLTFPMPQREHFSTAASPFEAFDHFLTTSVYPRLQDFTLLLMFDEFELFGRALTEGRLSRAMLDQLRHLIQHHAQLAFLFAGLQTLDEIGPEWSSYFINVRALTLGPLAPAEAEELIRRPDPSVEFPVEYMPEAVARILAQTVCHPYLVQLVCSCIVEEVNRLKTLVVDEALVQSAETLALERGAPYFRNVWDEMAGPAAQPLLRRIAAAPAPLTFDDDPATLTALQRLTRYRVCAKTPAGYVVEVPLVKRWVLEQ